MHLPLPNRGQSLTRRQPGNLAKSRPTLEVVPLTTTVTSRSSVDSPSHSSQRPDNSKFVSDSSLAEEIISWQFQEPICRIPIEKVDSLLFDPSSGVGGIADYTFVPLRDGKRVDGLVGKGKFSQVRLAIKDETMFAIKHTPLHPHHPLIATRLLREPDVLAELPRHPNLIQVFETIRTPGHFYLVEEYLNGYLTLDAFCSRYPSNTIPSSIAFSVLFQLTHVVKNALHSPISVCHRDIKPENVLIHPKTLRVVLLDFGLATHFSKSKKKLSTCCGSPAFHAPEIWKRLKGDGELYWGPEVDVWCIGLSLLRCVIGKKYPIGSSHTSLANMSHKVLSSLVEVEDDTLRDILLNFLNMNGDERLAYFRNFQIPPTFEAKIQEEIENLNVQERNFKTKSFLKTTKKFALDLKLVSPTLRGEKVLELGLAASTTNLSESGHLRSPTSPGSQRAKPLPLQILLRNRTGQAYDRILSFIKYTLRCYGILYHVLPPRSLSHPSVDIEKEDYPSLYLACVVGIEEDKKFNPSKATNALIMALIGPEVQRPNVQRSSSSPPISTRNRNAYGTKDGSKSEEICAVKFYMSITYWEGGGGGENDKNKSKSGNGKKSTSKKDGGFVVIEVSDRRVLHIVEKALELEDQHKAKEETEHSTIDPVVNDEDRGRRGRARQE